ncbi:hypothetical protein CCR75_002037 [Bremia lactucae]|uniref:RING-type domain-containing protein n=1 Tax=Bremia lactucae TaxID=4779 RepID=A0A976IBD3_BRELC|nr:hypothetical protein CCR75_002037 [Bremia lactucae]
MTRARSIAVWKAAHDGDEAKLQEILVESTKQFGSKLVNWKHHNHGTTPLMAAAESKHGEGIAWQLIAAGADVNLQDNTNLRNTALHYAAMTNHDSLTVNALLASGADAFAINRKGLTPLDLARKHRRDAAAVSLSEHMKIHGGWLFLRGKVHWRKRWGVVMACNKQRTSRELCIFRDPTDICPEAVLLVDESARASPVQISDKHFWSKREHAFTFDKPVMWQCVRRQKLTRSPICHKTMSLEDVQIRNIVFATDSLYNLEKWQKVLQSSNFYDLETGASLYGMAPYGAPHSELYYWPHEVVHNARMSALKGQASRKISQDPLYERVRQSFDQPPSQLEKEELLADILRCLGDSNKAKRDNHDHVQILKQKKVFQHPFLLPNEDEESCRSESSNEGSYASSILMTSSTDASSLLRTSSSDALTSLRTSSSDALTSLRTPSSEDTSDLCAMCYTRNRNAVCTPCGHRSGCLSCLKTAMLSSHACPLCRAQVDSVMRVYD